MKLAPSLPIADGTASGWSAPFAIVTAFALPARPRAAGRRAGGGSALAPPPGRAPAVPAPPVATYPDQFREVPRTVVLGVLGEVGAVTPVLFGCVFDSIFHTPFCSTSE